jgi:alpha-galactosidase
MEDSSKAVGLFNRGEIEATVTAKWSDLGLNGKQAVRDLWRQRDLVFFEGEFKATVPRHGVIMVRVRQPPQ